MPRRPDGPDEGTDSIFAPVPSRFNRIRDCERQRRRRQDSAGDRDRRGSGAAKVSAAPVATSVATPQKTGS